jgi:hypothetical protein
MLYCTPDSSVSIHNRGQYLPLIAQHWIMWSVLHYKFYSKKMVTRTHNISGDRIIYVLVPSNGLGAETQKLVRHRAI